MHDLISLLQGIIGDKPQNSEVEQPTLWGTFTTFNIRQ